MHKFAYRVLQGTEGAEGVLQGTEGTQTGVCGSNQVSNEINAQFKKQYTSFIKSGIEPIYIFDNRSNPLKKETQEKRQEAQKQQFVFGMYYTNLENQLKTENIGYIVCPEHIEAEQYAARNYDYVLTEDLDTLVFGGKNVLTKLNTFTGVCLLYNLDNLLSNLDLTLDNFIDLCIICGCDFNQSGLVNYGPNKGLKMIKTKTTSELKEYLQTNVKDYTEIYEIFKKI
jgi:flap endonuclease-1